MSATPPIPRAKLFAALAGDVWANPQADLFRGWEPFCESYPTAGLLVPGALYQVSSTEYPSDDDGYSVVSLASILETESDYLARHPGATHSDWLAYVRKYLLSPTAARGILRRAERRKKTLPPHLQEALQLVAGSMPPDDEGKMT